MYVDGFVVPVPKRKLDAYLKIARTASKVFMEHGALEYREAVGDDVPYGKRTSFPRSVKATGAETVIFAWIVYKSRAHRDRVMKAAMTDKRFAGMDKKMPFDGRRMIYGGFKVRIAA
jgi:uncharacterized protein YbaA (DUF1428 family)